MLVVVVVAVIKEGEPAALVEAETEPYQPHLLLVQMELPILAVGVAVVVTQMVQNQAVQVSSSLNTPHPYNRHSSTVALASG
jgi:hypothetical protein